MPSKHANNLALKNKSKVVAFVHYLNTKHLGNNQTWQTIMTAILRDVTETAQIGYFGGLTVNKNSL